MNFGLAASARAISTRRRSPPDSAAEAVAQMGDVELFHQLFGAVFALFAGEVGANLQHRHQVVVHAQAAEDRRFLRQVTDAAARGRAAAAG